MLWGAGLTPVKILPSFKPSADYGIKFGRALNGAAFRVDRGQASDVHSCTFTVSGEESSVHSAYEAIAGREATGSESVLIRAGEWIFGPATAVDQGYVLSVKSVGRYERTGLRTFSFDVTVSGIIAYDTSYGSPALPAVFIPSLSHSSESSVGAVTTRSYIAANSFTSKIPTTFGEFSFSQVMKKADAARLQMYFGTVNRGARIADASFPEIKGVANPWGVAVDPAADIYIRALSFEPMSPNYWRVNVILQKAQ